MKRKPIGTCLGCLHWEPDASGFNGLCPILKRITDVNYGRDCESWKQHIPESLGKEDMEPFDRDAPVSGTRMVGEITFLLWLAGAIIIWLIYR